MKLVPVAYLASYLLSLLGNSIAGIALPLIVLQVTGSALGAGAVAAATATPAVLAGLLMGVVIDRINRRTSSVVTDFVSAAAIAALPLIDMISGLSLGWFVLFGIIGSLGDVPGMTARDALLPAIVRHGGIASERLMGIREALGAVALLLGPAAAGTLMVLFDGSTVLWITAATSLTAALLTLLIPHRVGMIVTADGAAATTTENGWTQLRDGWRVLFRSPFLVVTTTLSLASVIVLASLQGLILPVYFTLVEEPGMLGFVLTALAAGMLVGGTVYAVAGTRGRRRAWFLAGLIGSTIGFAIIAALPSVWIVFAGAFVVGLSSGLFGSLIGVLMIERVPEQMRGRITGTQNAIMTAAPPVGIVAAAVLTEYAGVNVAAVVLASVWLVALVLGLSARSLRNLEPEKTQTASDGTAVARVHSGELARLAGVTVRALRHYHQVGVLAEPQRHSNGYRDYDVHDLIRVLRIKRLAALGIPLERMPDLLDDTGGDAGELLDELDTELAAQIDRLTEQRGVIARLRTAGAAPDLPPELAPFLSVLAVGVPPELEKFDRDQSVLLAHLAGEDGMPHIARFYERLSDPDLVPAVADISARFGRLGPDSTEQDVAGLIESFMTTFAPRGRRASRIRVAHRPQRGRGRLCRAHHRSAQRTATSRGRRARTPTQWTQPDLALLHEAGRRRQSLVRTRRTIQPLGSAGHLAGTDNGFLTAR